MFLVRVSEIETSTRWMGEPESVVNVIDTSERTRYQLQVTHANPDPVIGPEGILFIAETVETQSNTSLIKATGRAAVNLFEQMWALVLKENGHLPTTSRENKKVIEILDRADNYLKGLEEIPKETSLSL